jgi:cell wall-associated NlpC family hydrolase
LHRPQPDCKDSVTDDDPAPPRRHLLRSQRARWLRRDQHHQALLELEQTQQEILDAEGRIGELEEELGVQQDRFEQYAIEAYMGGDSAPSIDTFLESEEPNEVGTKVAYLSVASDDRQDVLDSLNGAQAALDRELGHLNDAEAEAERLEQEAADALAGAQQAVLDEEDVYARVQGELATLVAQEEARRAEEARRRAEEAAREAAEEAQQDEPPAAPPQDDVDDANADPTTPVTPPPTVPTDPPPGGGGGPTAGADIAVSTALSLLGTPYVWGGGSPDTGFDCSGFTSYVWAQGGKSLPHSAAAQAGMVRQLPLSALLPGDLVFYGWGYIHHVALYIGGGQIVHAPRRGDVVRIDSIYYWDQLHWAGRLP